MTKYLDETGLRTLWTKIKGTFVAQTIKKSDSSNATQITHNGDTVSLSRGTISGTGNTSTYTASASIDIGTNDIITFTSTSRPQYRVEENTDLIPMAFLRDIPKVDIALSSDSTNPVQNKVVTSALNGKSNTGHTHSYNDLTDKPTIGNAQITIKQNGTVKGSFTLNQTSPKTIDLIDTTYTPATTSAPGLMSAADKTKLDGIATGATNITVDSTLSSTSTNPVQNKVIFTALNNKINTSDFNAMKGVTNGLATLDSNGKVPSSQLPSYVDDVIEGYYYNSKFYKEKSHTNEIAGESGKIYTDLGNNKTYRWSGTTYTEISASLALGETSSTAYPGNKGAANAANIKTNTTNITTLKDYFTNGVAKQAAADGNGKNIADTYATKSALSTTNSNVSTNTTNITTLKNYFTNGVANKAAADGNGDNIVNTYATKLALSSTNSNVTRNVTDIAALQRHFDENGDAKVAVVARNDVAGNDIMATYATKKYVGDNFVKKTYEYKSGTVVDKIFTFKSTSVVTSLSYKDDSENSLSGIYISLTGIQFLAPSVFQVKYESGGTAYDILTTHNMVAITETEINTICQ